MDKIQNNIINQKLQNILDNIDFENQDEADLSSSLDDIKENSIEKEINIGKEISIENFKPTNYNNENENKNGNEINNIFKKKLEDKSENDIDENLIDIDEIIEDFENKEINKKKCFLNTIKSYIKDIFYELYPYKRQFQNKIFIFIIRLIQLFLLLFLVIGFLLPKKLIPYHVILCILTIISNELFNNKNIISIIAKKIGNFDKYYPLIQVDNSNQFILFVLILSIYSILVPKYSLFNLIKKIVIFFKKFN